MTQEHRASGYDALTDREKQTLRLLLAGHDAKSMARALGLSVHTINERLRDARRKLSVSSSKEAARVLRERERGDGGGGTDPQSFADARLGDAAAVPAGQSSDRAFPRPRTSHRAAWAIGGLAMISMIVAALALLAPAPSPPAGPTAAPPPANAPAVQAPVADSAASRAARAWLTLVDAGKWEESWAATAASFQSLNTVAAWRSASLQARVPLGRVLSRTLLSDQDVPAPPNGYRVVRFRTDYENRRGATETVSLDREGGSWKVVGCYIE